MGLHRGEQSIEIAAMPEACFVAVTDYDTFPEWQDAVRRVEVSSAHTGCGGTSWRATSLTSRASSRWSRPARARSSRTPWASTPGVPVPGIVMGRLNRQVMRRWVKDLRDEVERRESV